jgi:hypothetical protein
MKQKQLSYDIERRDIQWLAQTELTRLMAEHSLYISAADFPNWRPTVRSSGNIPGVADNVTIIATNGLLAYFLQWHFPVTAEEYVAKGETPKVEDCVQRVLIGHIQRFDGEVKPMFVKQKEAKLTDPGSASDNPESVSKPKRQAKPKSKRQMLLESI